MLTSCCHHLIVSCVGQVLGPALELELACIEESSLLAFEHYVPSPRLATLQALLVHGELFLPKNQKLPLIFLISLFFHSPFRSKSGTKETNKSYIFANTQTLISDEVIYLFDTFILLSPQLVLDN